MVRYLAIYRFDLPFLQLVIIFQASVVIPHFHIDTHPSRHLFRGFIPTVDEIGVGTGSTSNPHTMVVFTFVNDVLVM